MSKHWLPPSAILLGPQAAVLIALTPIHLLYRLLLSTVMKLHTPCYGIPNECALAESFYVYECFACVYICALHECVVPTEVRKGCVSDSLELGLCVLVNH